MIFTHQRHDWVKKTRLKAWDRPFSRGLTCNNDRVQKSWEVKQMNLHCFLPQAFLMVSIMLFHCLGLTLTLPPLLAHSLCHFTPLSLFLYHPLQSPPVAMTPRVPFAFLIARLLTWESSSSSQAPLCGITIESLVVCKHRRESEWWQERPCKARLGKQTCRIIHYRWTIEES